MVSSMIQSNYIINISKHKNTHIVYYKTRLE